MVPAFPLNITLLNFGSELGRFSLRNYLICGSLCLFILLAGLIFIVIKTKNDYLIYGFLSVFALSANNICNIINIKKFIKWKKYKLEIKKHLKPIFILFSASIIITLYNNFDVTMLGIITVCYGLFRNQVEKDLRITAKVLSAAGISKLTNEPGGYVDDDIRITWIAADGSVLYDNDVSADTMTNHMDRPEVRDAFEKGWGESVRKSDTLNMRNFYQAILLEDGTVLRVSIEARSMTSVFFQTFPIMLIVILFIIIICVFLSNLLTKQLLLPIKKMAEKGDSFFVRITKIIFVKM